MARTQTKRCSKCHEAKKASAFYKSQWENGSWCKSHQIAQLYKTSGLPRQSFTETMRESASTSLHGLAERVRPKRSEF